MDIPTMDIEQILLKYGFQIIGASDLERIYQRDTVRVSVKVEFVELP